MGQCSVFDIRDHHNKHDAPGPAESGVNVYRLAMESSNNSNNNNNNNNNNSNNKNKKQQQQTLEPDDGGWKDEVIVNMNVGTRRGGYDDSLFFVDRSTLEDRALICAVCHSVLRDPILAHHPRRTSSTSTTSSTSLPNTSSLPTLSNTSSLPALSNTSSLPTLSNISSLPTLSNTSLPTLSNTLSLPTLSHTLSVHSYPPILLSSSSLVDTNPGNEDSQPPKERDREDSAIFRAEDAKYHSFCTSCLVAWVQKQLETQQQQREQQGLPPQTPQQQHHSTNTNNDNHHHPDHHHHHHYNRNRNGKSSTTKKWATCPLCREMIEEYCSADVDATVSIRQLLVRCPRHTVGCSAFGTFVVTNNNSEYDSVINTTATTTATATTTTTTATTTTTTTTTTAPTYPNTTITPHNTYIPPSMTTRHSHSSRRSFSRSRSISPPPSSQEELTEMLWWERHEQECGFVEVVCPNHTRGCPLKVLRKDLISHISQCSSAPISVDGFIHPQ